jgi:hypothetical protein
VCANESLCILSGAQSKTRVGENKYTNHDFAFPSEIIMHLKFTMDIQCLRIRSPCMHVLHSRHVQSWNIWRKEDKDARSSPIMPRLLSTSPLRTPNRYASQPSFNRETTSTLSAGLFRDNSSPPSLHVLLSPVTLACLLPFSGESGRSDSEVQQSPFHVNMKEMRASYYMYRALTF